MWLLYFYQRNEIYRDIFHSLNIVKNLFLYISVYILILYISLSIPKMLKLCLFAHCQFKKIKKKKEKGRIKGGGRQRKTVFLVSFTRGWVHGWHDPGRAAKGENERGQGARKENRWIFISRVCWPAANQSRAECASTRVFRPSVNF